jgi:hypothetical protein
MQCLMPPDILPYASAYVSIRQHTSADAVPGSYMSQNVEGYMRGLTYADVC